MIESGKKNNALKEIIHRYKNLENKIFHNQGSPQLSHTNFFLSFQTQYCRKFDLNLIFYHIVTFLFTDFFFIPKFKCNDRLFLSGEIAC